MPLVTLIQGSSIFKNVGVLTGDNTIHSSTDSGWNPPESYPFLVHSKENYTTENRSIIYKRNYHKKNK